MVDLTSEMLDLWTGLGPPPANGRMVVIASPHSGAGASTVSREFARVAAVRARRPVWLVDADLPRQGQAHAVARAPERFGRLGPARPAVVSGTTFLTARGAMAQAAPVVRPALGGRLWVTQVPPGAAQPALREDDRFWTLLRRLAGAIVVDAPALDRSDDALILGSFADAVVLVLSPGDRDSPDALQARDLFFAVGAPVSGVVLNEVQAGAGTGARRSG